MNFGCDGFYGTLFAVEGISDAMAVLNGPLACRGMPAYFSDMAYPRDNKLKRRNHEEFFFFGQSRIPSTHLDSDDYIMGSTDKLSLIMPFIAEKGDSFVAIVNSPGASLIGDDLNRFLSENDLDDRCMAFESSSYSKTVGCGFDNAMVSILSWMKLNCLPKIKKRVNLLGLSIYHKHWEGTIDELTRLCSLMGLDVVSAPGAGSCVSEMRESVTASYNILICPEYSDKTAGWYENTFGIPAIRSPGGAPIGFEATEEWIRTIAEITGADPTAALDYINEMRRAAFHKLSRFYSEKGYPKGTTFSVEGDASSALPLVKWLYEYLNMLPVSVMVNPESDMESGKRLEGFLASHSLEGVLGKDPEEARPDIYIGGGLMGEILKYNGFCKKNIDIANRSGDYIDVVPKTLMGGAGALYLLEQILNAVNTIKYQNLFI